MNPYPTPRIVVSRCIEFDFCRYNAAIIRSNVVSELKPFIEFIPICPEVEIGLGIPRDPIRIVQDKNNNHHLIQPNTERDLTEPMTTFARSFLDKLHNIDGFLLKNSSPSCGIKVVKRYGTGKPAAPLGRGPGFFGNAVILRFPFLAIEDEKRLNNPTIREHFLRKIYTFAAFRTVKQKPHMNALVQFHTKNKLLLMAYHQQKLRELGRIVANQNHKPLLEVIQDYENTLYLSFARSPRCTSNINVLMHAFGYVKGNISSEEKQFFFKAVEQYRNGKISLASVLTLLKSWIIRFNEPFLSQQTFFSPYPDALIHAEAVDSCSERAYLK